MIRWAGRAIAAWLTSRADLITENLCLRQQLIVLQRRTPRPRLRDGDRRFWILACRWVPRWRESLLVVQPATVLGWHRRGWRAYWRWRSRCRTRGGRPRIAGELRALIRRMAAENPLWGQRRVQAELARLGYRVSARTVATYMRKPYNGVPSPSWREFLMGHAKDIWACDFFSVRTIFFRMLAVFFVTHHETRRILQVRVTRHPTAEWAAQQVVDACGWDRDPPRYLIRDRDGRFGIEFDRRVQRLGVTRIRTPVRAPRANALAERWIRSARSECLQPTHMPVDQEDGEDRQISGWLMSTRAPARGRRHHHDSDSHISNVDKNRKMEISTGGTIFVASDGDQSIYPRLSLSF